MFKFQSMHVHSRHRNVIILTKLSESMKMHMGLKEALSEDYPLSSYSHVMYSNYFDYFTLLVY